LLRFWRATINSRNGLAFAVRSEQAIREEVAALAIALPLAWLIGKTTMRSVELVAVVMLVLAIELLNTAIEKLADRLTTRTIRRSDGSRIWARRRSAWRC